MGRPIKIAKRNGSSLVDAGYGNEAGLGVVGGEVDASATNPDVKTLQVVYSLDGITNKTGWVLRQKGSRKFLVTDGTDAGTGLCGLVPKDPSAATLNKNEMSIQITLQDTTKHFLAKFNDTIGTAGDGKIYHLTFGNPSVIPPAGSTYQIAQVAST